MKNNKKMLLTILTFFIILLTITSMLNFNSFSVLNNNQFNKSNFQYLDLNNNDYQETNQWIKNPNFNPPINETWSNSKSGDLSDMELLEGTGQIEYTVIGDSGILNYTWDPPTQSDWVMMRNPDLPLFPNDTNSNGWIGFDSAGIFANHTWDEEAGDAVGQNPSVLFKRNESASLNISDYRVTSASISSIVNFSADSSVEKLGDYTPQDSYTYDHVRTYIIISDLNETISYEIAYYKYKNDSTLADTYMNTVPEQDLVYYLNNIFEKGTNFTITLGINFFCEDNDWLDVDIWNYVRIKSLNLSFTYQKKINQDTRGYWSQTSDNLTASPNNFEINEATFNFKYKINSSWPSSSPNSEIIIKINNNTLSQTLKLSSASSTFQEAKIGGFDVTNLLVKNENISVILEFVIADNFDLSDNRTLSIDDVTLNITITIFEPRIQRSIPPIIFPPGADWGWLIFLLCLIISALLVTHGIYVKYIRIPSLIRKIKKLKKNIKKNNVENPVKVKERKDLIQKNLIKSLKSHKIEPPTRSMQPKPSSTRPKPHSERTSRLKLLLFFFAFFLFLIFAFSTSSNMNSPLNFTTYYNGKIHLPKNSDFQIQTKNYQESDQWIKNPLFDPPIDQYWSTSKTGDLSDIDLTEDTGFVNYVVIGDNRTENYKYNPPQVNDWTMMRDPDYAAFPNDTVNASGENAWCWIDNEGAFLNHTWHEEAGDEVGQISGALWKQNKTLPVNMTDYEITSASISALVNASPSTNIEEPGEGPGAQFQGSGDYIKFFIRISDISGNLTYTIAYYKYYDDINLSDTLMSNVTESDLIFFLSSVLQSDGYNFTIVMGINVWCEDNDVLDNDDWYYIRIKSVNLSFSYRKKINQFTIGKWTQISDRLGGGNFLIDEAKLYFQYKIDTSWTSQSPNSEFRITINNNTHAETIKLSTANGSFQDAKVCGFDVTNFIAKNENISVTIEMYIADNFPLSSNITVSIDNVSLFITRTFIVIPDISPLLLFLPPLPLPWFLYFLILIIIILSVSFAAYMQFFRTPPPVRKVKRLKSAIKKGKVDKPLKVDSREVIIQKEFQKKLKSLPLGKVMELDTSELLTQQMADEIANIISAKILEMDTSELLTEQGINEVINSITAKVLELDTSELLTEAQINEMTNLITAKVLELDTSELLTQQSLVQITDAIKNELIKSKPSMLKPNFFKMTTVKIKAKKGKAPLLNSMRFVEPNLQFNELVVTYNFQFDKSVTEIVIKETIPKNLKIKKILPASVKGSKKIEKGKYVQEWKITPELAKNTFQFGYVCLGKGIIDEFPFEISIPGKNLTPTKTKTKEFEKLDLFVPEFHNIIQKYKTTEN